LLFCRPFCGFCLCYLLSTCCKNFERRFSVNVSVVLAGDGAQVDHALALGIGQRARAAGRWANKGTFDDGGCTLFLQGRDQSLTGSKGGNDIRRVERRVLAECVGGSSDRFLLTWRIGTQGVLHPVAKLRKYGFRHIKR